MINDTRVLFPVLEDSAYNFTNYKTGSFRSLFSSHYKTENEKNYEKSFKNVIDCELSNMRSASPKQKNISTVSGSGRKPRPQKHTGRSRQGSVRATQWVGGASPFGEQVINYSKRLNLKEVNSSFFFSTVTKPFILVIPDDIELIKTKDARKLIDNVKKYAKENMKNTPKSYLVVFSSILNSGEEKSFIAFRNLRSLACTDLTYLSVFSTFTFDLLVFTESALNEFIHNIDKIKMDSIYRKGKIKGGTNLV